MILNTQADDGRTGAGDAAPGAGALPRLLVLSEDALSRSNGTGMLFSRSFGFYPRERLANWYIKGGADPLLDGAVDFSTERWRPSPALLPAACVRRLWNRLGGRPVWPMPVNAHALAAAARRQAFQPEIVYAVAYSGEGFEALRGLLDGVSDHVPVVLHCQDFFPSGSIGFMAALRRLAPRISEVWAVSEAILRTLEEEMPGTPKRFEPPFVVSIPPYRKQRHRAPGPDFRAVIVGNLWNPSLLPLVRRLWGAMMCRLPGLPSLQWHCHPHGVARVREAGHDLGVEIVPAAYLSDDALCRTLAEADLALVPLGAGAEGSGDYERYSMPSRLAELCAVGLPFVCLSGPGTPLRDYVATHGIGCCIDPAAGSQAEESLAALLHGTDLRNELGKAARRHAEAHFGQQQYQARLALRLRTLAAGGGRDSRAHA